MEQGVRIPTPRSKLPAHRSVPNGTSLQTVSAGNPTPVRRFESFPRRLHQTKAGSNRFCDLYGPFYKLRCLPDRESIQTSDL
jgi:hypothetical protein